MRKREIHSVAHWAMMFILLMFPILMVAISVFEKPNETSYTQRVNVDYNESTPLYDVYFTFNNEQVYANQPRPQIYFSNYQVIDTNISADRIATLETASYIKVWVDNNSNYINWDTLGTNLGSGSFYLTLKLDVQAITNSNDTLNDTLLYRLVTVDDNSYKGNVNKWINQFLDLPINSWYRSLMNVIGVGFTNSSVMNVIYVMPVYILWVFIFDVIVDCFLVIIKLPHKLLNRLSGGENE